MTKTKLKIACSALKNRETSINECQYALKIDPLCASKIDPPTAKYTVLFLTSFYIDGLHI